MPDELESTTGQGWFGYGNLEAPYWFIGAGHTLAPAWPPLISLLLSYAGAESYDAGRIADYQSNYWGRRNGRMCIIELSDAAGIAALRAQIRDRRPVFVLFFGSRTDHWREIAGHPLAEGEPKLVDGTVYCGTTRPTTNGRIDDYWMILGRKIRAVVPPLGLARPTTY